MVRRRKHLRACAVRLGPALIVLAVAAWLGTGRTASGDGSFSNPRAQPIPFGVAGSAVIAPRGGPRGRITTAQARRWIRDLASRQYAVRRSAQQRLSGCGRPALPYIFRAVQQTTQLRPNRMPQRREALRRLLDRLRARQAAAPTIVTVRAHEMPQRKILYLIGKQSGCDYFCSAPITAAPLTFDAVRTPFWRVVRMLETKTHQNIYWRRGPPGERKFPGMDEVGLGFYKHPTCVRGAFILTALAMHRRSHLHLSIPPAPPSAAQRRFIIESEVTCEPKVPVVAGGSMILDSGMTNTGKSLVRRKREISSTWEYDSAADGWGGNLRLAYLNNEGSYIKKLTCHWSCLLATRIHRWRISWPFTGASRTVGNTTVAVLAVHPIVGDGWSITLRVSNARGAAPLLSTTVMKSTGLRAQTEMAAEMSFIGAHLRVQGKRRGRFAPNGPQGDGHGTMTARVCTYDLYPTGTALPGHPRRPPARLLVPIATKFRAVIVPFTLRDLPLP